MTANPLAVAADKLGVPYEEKGRLAWALLGAIVDYFNTPDTDPHAEMRLYGIVSHMFPINEEDIYPNA